MSSFTLRDSILGTNQQPIRPRVLSILNRTEIVRRSEGKAGLKWLCGLVAALILSFSFTAVASAQTKTLKLHFTHTKERAEITFMRNGRYDQRGLQQINQLLRDWRRNEPAKMNPKLMDLLWEVYRSVGAKDYIHVVSAYRSPATNNMLRGRSSGVAKNSQHTLGNAIDFFIPGVSIAKIRAAGFKLEGGGVGFYPKSGSPFVHLDVGNVRAWPRMSRNELMALFPDGRTIHVPSDGKPLPGYQQAMASYKRRQASGGTVQLASVSPAAETSSSSGGGLLSGLFGRNNRAEPEPAPAPRRAPAAQRSEPSRAVAPEPVAPAPEPTAETILAALPARSVPVPGAAPRPMVDVGAPVRPLIPGLPSQANQAPPEPVAVAAPVEVAINVPLPSRRPDFTPAPVAEQAVQVAAVELPATTDLPISAIAAERPRAGGADAISGMLATSAADARADVVFNVPVPSLRPRLPDEGQHQVAALAPDASTADVFVLASLPDTSAQVPAPNQAVASDAGDVTAQKQTRIAALSASPRVAVIGREAGLDVSTALDSGVRTTPKGAKPRASAARSEPRPVAVPLEEELTRWAFRRDVTVSTAGGTTEKSQAYNTVWSAPQTVYSAGFQQGAPNAQPNRFTGKAVTFMPVARFGTTQ